MYINVIQCRQMQTAMHSRRKRKCISTFIYMNVDAHRIARFDRAALCALVYIFNSKSLRNTSQELFFFNIVRPTYAYKYVGILNIVAGAGTLQVTETLKRQLYDLM